MSLDEYIEKLEKKIECLEKHIKNIEDILVRIKTNESPPPILVCKDCPHIQK